MAEEKLAAGESVAIDNTNADTDIRARWIALAKKHNVPIRCVHFVAEPEICKHNDAVRAMNSIVSWQHIPYTLHQTDTNHDR